MKTPKLIGFPLLAAAILGMLGISGTPAIGSETSCMEWTKVSGGGTGGIARIKDPKTVEWIITNAYPGWTGALHLTATNLGTVAMKFKQANLIIRSDPNGLMTYVKSALRISYDPDGSGPEPKVPVYWIQNQWEPFDEVDDKMNNDPTLLSMTLQPGGWIRFGDEEEGEDSIHLKIDETACSLTENATLRFTLEIIFEQPDP